jgi:hypothetical protein
MTARDCGWWPGSVKSRSPADIRHLSVILMLTRDWWLWKHPVHPGKISDGMPFPAIRWDGWQHCVHDIPLNISICTWLISTISKPLHGTFMQDIQCWKSVEFLWDNCNAQTTFLFKLHCMLNQCNELIDNWFNYYNWFELVNRTAMKFSLLALTLAHTIHCRLLANIAALLKECHENPKPWVQILRFHGETIVNIHYKSSRGYASGKWLTIHESTLWLRSLATSR